jgi:hypothetical protein
MSFFVARVSAGSFGSWCSFRTVRRPKLRTPGAPLQTLFAAVVVVVGPRLTAIAHGFWKWLVNVRGDKKILKSS